MMGSSSMKRYRGVREPAFLEPPGVVSLGMAMAMSGEESSAIPPKQRPDLFAIGFGQRQRAQLCAGKEGKPALGMGGRDGRQPNSQFEQEHEPVGLPCITML